MPISRSRQDNRWPNWQAKRWKFGRVAKVAPPARDTVVRVGRAHARNQEEYKRHSHCSHYPTRRCPVLSHSENDGKLLTLQVQVICRVAREVSALVMTIPQDVPWTDYEEAIPAFVTLVLMPFTYSITNGIGAGFIAYTLFKVPGGKIRSVHPLLLLATAAFVVYFGLSALSH